MLGEGAFGEVWMATAVGMENFQPRKGDKNTRFQLRNPFKKRRRRTVVAVKKLKGEIKILCCAFELNSLCVVFVITISDGYNGHLSY